MSRITVNIKGVERSLYFGMTAIQIFSEKSVMELQQLALVDPKAKIGSLKADPVKSFAYIVYAGMCNQADIEQSQRPTFPFCYEVAEEILFLEENVQTDIYTAFSESRANKALLERLNGVQKKSPAKVTK